MSSVYNTANILANIVSVTEAVLEEVCGNELASISSFEDKSAVPNAIAVTLQTKLTPLLTTYKPS